VAERGPPVAVRVVAFAGERFRNLVLVWGAVTVQLSMRDGDAWQIGYEEHAREPHPEAPGFSLANARSLLLGAQERLARAPIRGDAVRTAALEAWLDTARFRVSAAGALTDLALTLAPDAPVTQQTFHDIFEHARWVHEHEQIFPNEGDPRDALVLCKPGADLYRASHAMGWRSSSASLDDGREARVVRAPFAAGVLRVSRDPTALASIQHVFPAPDPVPESEIRVTETPPPPNRRKLPARQLTVTHVPTGVSVAGKGYEPLEVLRVLVAQLSAASRK
jgi:hypothetical protein